MIRFFGIWITLTAAGGLVHYLNRWHLSIPYSEYSIDIVTASLAPIFVLLLNFLHIVEIVPYLERQGEELVRVDINYFYNPESVARIAVFTMMFLVLKFLMVFFLNRKIEKKSKC